jgi:KUP system potassium uptake protein
MTAEPARTTLPPQPPTPESPASLGLTGARPIPPLRHRVDKNPRGKRLAILTLTALGVVYGDIGTSPLYAIKECFKPDYGLTPTVVNVYGVLSLIVWALLLVVTVKYVGFILRADNRGEGGVLALLALVLQREHREEDRTRRKIIIWLGIFGGAFLYGDGIITPAISVLGAVEGLEVAAPALAHFVLPIAVLLIAALFYVQDRGTAKVGGWFGYVMLLWFVTIGALGTLEIARQPHVLSALNPWYGISFFYEHPARSFVILGAVVLVITGGEALYADMGHFGKRPIRLAWFSLVLPALLLNYFGQGSLVLRNPLASDNPFYLLAPPPFQIPLLVIATAAAIVASQALISGAFSLTQQAVQLGYVPRVTIKHTSAHEAGQIYIPEVNKLLALGTLLLVIGFRSSTALGAAYGVAVTGTMAITTMLFVIIVVQRWGWSRWWAYSFGFFFLAIDLAFFASNVLKIPHGGWVPLGVAAVVFVLMTTWKKGREILRDILTRASLPLDLFLEDVERRKPVRVSGTAIFMTSAAEGAPVVLLHHLKHNKVLHEQVILMSVQSEEVPEVPPVERVTIERFAAGFFRVTARYGFMESPDVKEILAYCSMNGLDTKPNETSYYLGRERLIPFGRSWRERRRARAASEGAQGTPQPIAPQMMLWRKRIFVLMSRNARSATEFFGIPPNRVVELGAQIEF